MAAATRKTSGVLAAVIPLGSPTRTLAELLVGVRDCRLCEAHLPLGLRPILRAHETARILIVGQAPGLRVHTTGMAWDDASGERLRAWMGLDKDIFYDESRVVIIPMGNCDPRRAESKGKRLGEGKREGKSGGGGGELPPRRECAAVWLDQWLARLPHIQLTLLVGQYAQRHFLGSRRHESLAQTVQAWQEYAPPFIPLPHPSPRNQPWFKKHPWFEQQLVPALRIQIKALIAEPARALPLQKSSILMSQRMTHGTPWTNLFTTSRAVYFLLGISLATALSIYSCDASCYHQRNGHPQSADQDMNAYETSASPTHSGRIAQCIALS